MSGIPSSKSVECCKWVDKKIHGNAWKFVTSKSFQCKSYQAIVQKSPEKKENLKIYSIEVVKKFCLRAVLCTNEGAHDSVVFGIKA